MAAQLSTAPHRLAFNAPKLGPGVGMAFDPRPSFVGVGDDARASERVATPVHAEARRTFQRRRLIVGLAAIVVGATIWSALGWFTGAGGTDRVGAELTPEAPRATVVVQPGDTLWSIAAEIDTDGDVRDTVDLLAELNGGSALAVGQRVFLHG